MAKLLFLVTEDWYFHSHRLALGRAALAAGFEVVLVTRAGARRREIEDAGIRIRAIGWRRRGFRPVRELCALLAIWRIYRDERPDIVHHVALKPVVYGSLAARLAPVGAVVNAIAGLGFVFISARPLARVLRPGMKWLLGDVLSRGGAQVIVQNPDDRAAVCALGVGESNIALIEGSGVDENRFAVQPEPGLLTDAPTSGARGGARGGALRNPGSEDLARQGLVVATLVSRMLWDKGIGELVEAARILRGRGVPVSFRLVGAADDDNPASIPASVLGGWVAEGLVRWDGQVDDIPAVWASSHIALLPSYREGLPRSLLEAAAVGRAIVATDVPGCREIVRHNVNGYLVPARDPHALAAAIERLVHDRDARRRFGAASRRLVEERFAEHIVVDATLELYRRVLSERRADREPERGGGG